MTKPADFLDELIPSSFKETYVHFSLIVQVSYKHRGDYTCVAANSAASANYTATMVVNVPPRWKVAPMDKAAVVGENVVVDCQAEGFPPPRIWWEKSSGMSVISSA